VGVAVNVSAAFLHFSRSLGVYIGDARPLLAAPLERNAGLVHVMSIASLMLVAWEGGAHG